MLQMCYCSPIAFFSWFLLGKSYMVLQNMFEKWSASAGCLCIRALCTVEAFDCCAFGCFPQTFCRFRCLKELGLLFATRLWVKILHLLRAKECQFKLFFHAKARIRESNELNRWRCTWFPFSENGVILHNIICTSLPLSDSLLTHT